MLGNDRALAQAPSVVNVTGNYSHVNEIHVGEGAAKFHPQVTIVPVSIVLLHSKAVLRSEHWDGFVKH